MIPSYCHSDGHSLMEIYANNLVSRENKCKWFLMKAQSIPQRNFTLSYKPVMRQSLDNFMYFRHVILSLLAQFVISNHFYDLFSDKIPSGGDFDFLSIYQGTIVLNELIIV